MKNNFTLLICCIVFLINCSNNNRKTKDRLESVKTEKLKPWQEGYLDIHHINTGNGDTSFVIFPDGTTMLVDAGIIDKEKFEKRLHPLKATSTKPNDSLSAAQWVDNYIQQVKDTGPEERTIDYAVVSHYHSDHYGSVMELGDYVPIKKVIDRGYDFPFDMKAYLKKDALFNAYLSFLEEKDILKEPLKVGSASQIKLKQRPEEYPSFKVRNVKSNATIWTGEGENTLEYFTAEDMVSYYKGKFNENTLSLALKISYGNFDYFTGGDNTGLQGYGLPYWFDVETPMAKAVGKVEEMTLNHHSNRDATNEFFVKTLNPKVVIQQSWCSDHPGQEVYQRLIYKDSLMEDRDIFATNMHHETVVTYGPWFKNNYKSMHGHIVTKVYPKGEKYEVFILDDENPKLTVKEKYGPYMSK